MANSCIDEDGLRENALSRREQAPAAAGPMLHGLWRWLDLLGEWSERQAEAALLAHLDRREIKDLEGIFHHGDS